MRKDYPYTIVGWQKPKSTEEASKSFLVQVIIAKNKNCFYYSTRGVFLIAVRLSIADGTNIFIR